MKKLFTLFAMLTLLVSLNAQKINYQAVLRDTIDGKIELVRNQTGNVVFTVMTSQNADRGTQDLKPMRFETNADGMVNLTVDFLAELREAYPNEEFDIDWRDNMIIAEFTYGDNQKIILETPVTAVPYAIQAKDGSLNTGVITTYINNSGVADFNDIWKAFKDKEVLEKAVSDSIVEFLKLKENYEIAKKILYSYLNQVSGADVNEAYNTARNLDRETKDAIYSVMKDFLNNHHDLVIDVLEYYAQTATEEEMRAIYDDLKVSVGPAIKEYMNKYFDHYMETKGLVCEGKNLCDAIAAMNAGGSTPAGLTYFTVPPYLTSYQSQRFYYMPGETYGQALARDENKNLGWKTWPKPEDITPNSEYITIYCDGQEFYGDLYVNGDSDFMGGDDHVHPTSNNFNVTLETFVSPNDNLTFGPNR